MTIPITAHASSHNLTHHANAMTNRCSTKATTRTMAELRELYFTGAMTTREPGIKWRK